MRPAYGDVFRSREGGMIVMFIREDRTIHEGATWIGLILAGGSSWEPGETGTFRPVGAVNIPGARPVWEAVA